MDPTSNLREQLQIAKEFLKMSDQSDGGGIDFPETDVLRLAELVEALDGWIRNGGFLPAPWQK